MKTKLHLTGRLHWVFATFSKLLARKWKRKFYLYLAVLFTILALMDTIFLHLTSEIGIVTFDPIVRYRLFPPKPDPDIVIVDIDEASLSAMAKEYGRWPWPRHVLGDFVAQAEKQNPKQSCLTFCIAIRMCLIRRVMPTSMRALQKPTILFSPC
jgi:CHASE2 domain-containing sensor protein